MPIENSLITAVVASLATTIFLLTVLYIWRHGAPSKLSEGELSRAVAADLYKRLTECEKHCRECQTTNLEQSRKMNQILQENRELRQHLFNSDNRILAMANQIKAMRRDR